MLNETIRDILDLNTKFLISTNGKWSFLDDPDDRETSIFYAFDTALRMAGIKWEGGGLRNHEYEAQVNDISEILELFPVRRNFKSEEASWLNCTHLSVIETKIRPDETMNGYPLKAICRNHLFWTPEEGIFRGEFVPDDWK